MVAKRFWICLICGVIAGLICAWGGSSEIPEGVSKPMVFWSSLLNRAFIGFVLGISAWRIGWALHGILIGLLGTLPMSFPLIFSEQAGFSVFLIYTIAGIVWGFLIELVASVIFKAKMTPVTAVPAAAAPPPPPPPQPPPPPPVPPAPEPGPEPEPGPPPPE
jgi:hypothetical protein